MFMSKTAVKAEIGRYILTKQDQMSYHKAKVAVVQLIAGFSQHIFIKTLTKPYNMRS